MLNDGRVIVCGGEYEGSNVATRSIRCEIYDPISDTWAVIPSPPGITQIGDAPCCVFPDGRFMVGAINSTRCAIYDPATNTWAQAEPIKAERSEKAAANARPLPINVAESRCFQVEQALV